MKEFGAALRRAREHAGLTLQQLYDRTRINPKYLQDIENGNFPNLPQTYIRAFIKDYAIEVGLDEKEVLDAYNRYAESFKGVAPPPPPVDINALLPQPDGSIEIIGTSHTESQTPESEPQLILQPELEFHPPTPKKESDPPALLEKNRVERKHPMTDATKEPPARIDPQKKTSEHETPTAKPLTPSLRVELDTSAIDQERITERQTQVPVPPKKQSFVNMILSKEDAQEKEEKGAIKIKSAAVKPTRVYDTKPAIPTEEDISIPPIAVQKPPSPPKPPRKNSDVTNRTRLAAWLIIIIIVIAIYAIVEFGGKSTAVVPPTQDSTRIAAQIQAKKFIDSTQFAIPEPQTIPEDTSTVIQPKEEQALEPTQMKFAVEDSLLLEAFSTAPVWFQIRMDTTRSERGSMSSNEHRMWKAKDYFIVTLGDAGAVTFMLNGKNLGSFGEEGLVLKNQTITRQSIGKNQ